VTTRHDEATRFRFADILITYATTGSLATAGYHKMPPGYFNLANMLRKSLEYFVLGHEYAHIILGHLEAARVQKGILAVPDAEVIAWSWQQELDADWLGMVLSVGASMSEGLDRALARRCPTAWAHRSGRSRGHPAPLFGGTPDARTFRGQGFDLSIAACSDAR
jgi:hypothetical protein